MNSSTPNNPWLAPNEFRRPQDSLLERLGNFVQSRAHVLALVGTLGVTGVWGAHELLRQKSVDELMTSCRKAVACLDPSSHESLGRMNIEDKFVDRKINGAIQSGYSCDCTD